MSPRWLAVLGLLCVLVTTADSAALSTENTLVVARNEDEATPTQQPTSEEPITEEPSVPIKMTAMEVESVVALRYARTSVVARARNPARRAQEASFRVLLPDTAFISGFTMTLDGKSYKAYVKEKEEAKQIYSNAIAQGVGAAHIATKARDSNHFTVSVNVEANTSAVFNLTYEELLPRRDGLYSHAVNLHPGAPVPRLAVTVRVRETQRLRRLRVPPERTGNEVDAGDDSAQNPIATVERSEDGREATITFEPDLEEQHRLSEIYAVKSKESQEQSRFRDFYSQHKPVSDQKGALGQFVVQYDVETPNNGEVLVNDGYFVHFFAPASLPPINKHVVFVLDTSGSMRGRKIEQLQEAMRYILDELNPGDYFHIVEFNDRAWVYSLNQINTSLVKNTEKTIPPALATPKNIAKAKRIIDALHDNGVTDIESALNMALDLVHQGVDRTPSTTTPLPVSTENIKPLELEPMIIFLTDGQPNVGESNPEKLIAQVTKKNSSKKKASFFSLAFGEGADRSFLRKLSLRNDGFMRHIYEAADAALQLRAFYRQVASPLLADVTFVYPPDQVKEGSLTKTKFRTVYGGSETVVAGRVAGAGAPLEPQVIGVCGVEDSFLGKHFEVKPVKGQASGYLPLERLWVYLTIKQLLDERDAADSSESDKDNTSPGKRALELALKYDFVTPLTSLVVVKPNATSAVDAESVDGKSSSDPPSLLPGVMQSQFSILDRSAVHSFLLSDPLQPQYSVAQIASGPASFLSGAMQPQLSLRSNAMYNNIFGNYVPTRAMSFAPFPDVHLMAPPTTQRPLVSTTTQQPLLSKYHLDEFPWVATLLNVTSGQITVPQSTTLLQLTEDEAPKSSGGDEDCARATDGAAGRCVYLTRCRSARAVTAAQYATLHCAVNNKYAGVCCPKDEIDVKTSRQV